MFVVLFWFIGFYSQKLRWVAVTFFPQPPTANPLPPCATKFQRGMGTFSPRLVGIPSDQGKSRWGSDSLVIFGVATKQSLSHGGMADLGLSPVGGFQCFRIFFCVFFEMVRRWRHLEIIIRSSPPYPRTDGVSSASDERVESCVRRIFSDLSGFGNRWCGFRSVSYDLQLSSLVMVAALVCWSFRALARRLLVCLLEQALLWQALSGSSDGGARKAARLRLVLVFVVVARLSNELFVIFITVRNLCAVVDDY
jgi:hypothetical protein